jgi:gamma-glutamylcyclotransferase (GGCT)/AIG2-like uncharacterized protein YtfP
MYYFAYGSNMNLDQMKERCGENFSVLGTLKLDKYEIGFDSEGYANIRPKENAIVYGVLFEVNDYCLKQLDKYEGVPDVYRRQEIVIEFNDKIIKAITYIESPDEFNNKPRKDYLEKIIKGCEQNKLPREWIEKLKSFNI